MALENKKTIDHLNSKNLEELESWDAPDIIHWAFNTFEKKAAIGTSLQATGITQIDIACQQLDDFRVFTVDTLRLHEETYKYHERIQQFYGVDLEVYRPDPENVKRMIENHGEYLFFNSPDDQQKCCNVRKQKPFDRAITGLDVWICGLRRDQSEERQDTPKAQMITQNGNSILKLAPLVDWSKKEIWEYIEEHEVPYNPLYDEGYKTISCKICTTPVDPDEPPRAGRWRWFNEHDRECGLHKNQGLES